MGAVTGDTQRDSTRLPWAIVAVILIATIIDGMDTTIVNIILPDMAQDLGMSVSSSAFVMVSYLIPIAGLCLFFGKLADRTDIRRMFILGTVVFMISSAACALSVDSVTMLASRFVQGIGATFMVASTPIMVVRLLPENARGRGMGVIAAGTGISSILGAPLGGLLESLMSWHLVFLINIPLCILLIFLSYRVLPRGRPESVATVMPDVPSVVLMFIGMGVAIAVLYMYVDGIVGIPVTVASVIVAAILLILSVMRSDRSDRPLIDGRLVRDRRFVAVSAVFLISTMMGAGTIYLLPFYFTIMEGWEALMISMVMAVASVMAVALAGPTGKWCDSRGCRTPACVSLALRVLFCIGFMVIDPALGIVYAVAMMVVMGLSFGTSGTSQSSRMVADAPDDLAGDAGVTAMLMNYIGYAMGLALFAAVFTLLVPSQEGIDPDTFLNGFHRSMLMACVMAAIALAVSAYVRDDGRVDNVEAE